MIRVAVPRETRPGETRVALPPDGVRRLASDELVVAVESGAGRGAFHDDDAYREAGAEIVDDREALWSGADAVLKVAPPGPLQDGHEADLLREGGLLIGFLRPREEPERLTRLAETGVSALAFELLPRITRAQSMDALSSMSTLAGYRATLIGAGSLPQVFPMLMTAAGTLRPARVLVLGAGVAGLQAIATARRLGAVVEGYDIRPAVKEQVESLGATFVEWDGEEDEEGGGRGDAEGADERETEGGYARALEEDEQARQRRLIGRHARRADVVITTALVPGKPAPLLLTEEMVAAMKPGSVIVDLAGEAGGNCALSVADETVERHGVTIHAPLELPATLPAHASQMLGRNHVSLFRHLLRDGELVVDLEDEIVDACCATHGGEVRFRP